MKSKRKTKETINLGITNADLMFIHENGSPLNHIPARPVLQMTINWVNENKLLEPVIEKVLEAFLKSKGKYEECDKIMERFAIKIQNYARKLIYENDGRLAPNSPRTIKEKGDNHPLFYIRLYYIFLFHIHFFYDLIGFYF